ncbi:MAG TPA: hypothetical protein VIX37_06685 [Candidatus Sulfotelmatobacter sp.]
MERCRREIAAIEKEMAAGNPDVDGLLMGLLDWQVEWQLIEDEKRRQAGTWRR